MQHLRHEVRPNSGGSLRDAADLATDRLPRLCPGPLPDSGQEDDPPGPDEQDTPDAPDAPEGARPGVPGPLPAGWGAHEPADPTVDLLGI